MLRYSPTPVQEIHDPVLDTAGVRVLIKREDLNQPFVSGNNEIVTFYYAESPVIDVVNRNGIVTASFGEIFYDADYSFPLFYASGSLSCCN